MTLHEKAVEFLLGEHVKHAPGPSADLAAKHLNAIEDAKPKPVKPPQAEASKDASKVDAAVKPDEAKPVSK